MVAGRQIPPPLGIDAELVDQLDQVAVRQALSLPLPQPADRILLALVADQGLAVCGQVITEPDPADPLAAADLGLQCVRRAFADDLALPLRTDISTFSTSWPAAVRVSMESPTEKSCLADRPAKNSWMRSSQSPIERVSRSSLAMTTPSMRPLRRLSSARISCMPGRSRLFPEKPGSETIRSSASS